MEALLTLTTITKVEEKETVLKAIYKGELKDQDEFVIDGLEILTEKCLAGLNVIAVLDNITLSNDNDKVLAVYSMSKLYAGIKPWCDIVVPDCEKYCNDVKVWDTTKLNNNDKECVEKMNEEKLGKDCAEVLGEHNPKGLRQFVADMPKYSLEKNLEALKMRIKMLNAMKKDKYKYLVDELNEYTEEKKKALGDKGFKKVVAVLLGFFVKTAQLIVGVALFSLDFVAILIGFAGNMVGHTISELGKVCVRTGDAFSNDILYLLK